MILMYVDESGDIGTSNSPTKYFVLSAVVFHELRWKSVVDDLITFRRHLRDQKGLKLREEIHAAHFINHPGELKRIKRNDRIDILKKCIGWIKNQPDINILSIVTDKTNKSKEQVFEWTWQRLIQRFENTIRHRNFSGPLNPDDKGILLADRTDDKQLTQLVRKMRRFNPIPNTSRFYTGGFRDLILDYVIEDPIMRESEHSLIHQMVDVVCYCARQLYEPNKYMIKKGGHKFYERLEPLIVKHVAPAHPMSIVEI
jgi:hypothetical protein